MAKRGRSKSVKRITTIILLISAVLVVGGMQPMFFGARRYFGINPLTFLLPIAFVFLVCTFLHVQQNWSLFLAWFKKSTDKEKQRYKIRFNRQNWLVISFLIFKIVIPADKILSTFLA
ncbi:MAG: hypothetical protein ABIE43_02270 [Patescibacteria group bacterium]